MDQSERMNKMARLVFNKGNLEQVKEGLDLLFNVFVDILEEPFEHGTCFTHGEIMERLERLEQKKWRPIRNMFLQDPFYGYVQGDFSMEEKASPAKILLDFISIFEAIKRNSEEKLEHYKGIVTTLSKEKREFEGRVAKLEMKESDNRMGGAGDRAELIAARGSIAFLEKSVAEKNEKIAELQREKNVQLWEREKQKALAEFNDRMEALEQKNAELQRQNQSLTKKCKMAEDLNKKNKIEMDLRAGTIPPSESKSEEELKRILYLQEKDLTAMERELLSQQRIFSTVLSGIKTDLFIVGESLTDPDTGQIPFKDFTRLTGLVETIAKGIANGDVEAARKDLPPHYTYLPANFKMKRIHRVSHLAKDKLPPLRGLEGGEKQNQNGDAGNEVTLSANHYVDTIVENPRLVDPENDIVDFVTCMKHFPHISVDFIKDHWWKFKEFDSDKSGSLDFSEVIHALKCMGLKFNADQAEEAMREADVNQSRTLDFFEYILVVDKIVQRTGRSELFHTSPSDRKVLSKTCVVQ